MVSNHIEGSFLDVLIPYFGPNNALIGHFFFNLQVTVKTVLWKYKFLFFNKEHPIFNVVFQWGNFSFIFDAPKSNV